MQRVVDALLSLSGAPAFALVGGLAFAEAAALVGLVVPGEVAVLLGGVLAAQGRVDLGLMMAVASVAAVAGDSVGYELGRRYGRRVLDRPGVRARVGGQLDRAEAFLHTHGGRAVFLGRWTSVLRALVPAVAGMARVPYGTFLLFNVLGGVAWAVTFVLLGYLAGASWRRVEEVAGPASALVLVLVLLLWGVRLLVRRLTARTEQVRVRLARLADTAALRWVRTTFARPLGWATRRFTPGTAKGLGWTLSLAAGVGAAWVLGAAVQDLLAREELVLLDRPVAAWVAAHTTPQAARVAATVVAWTGPPGGVWLVGGVAVVAWWGRGPWAASRVLLAAGLTVLAATALQSALPTSPVGTRFPAISVAWLTAAAIAAIPAVAGRSLPAAIRLAGAAAAVLLVVAVAELVSAETALSGIVGGLGLGGLLAAGGELTTRTVTTGHRGSRVPA